MTDNVKKFFEAVSNDEGAKKEFETMTAGLSKDDRKGFTDALVKFAAAKGFTLTAGDFEPETKELSLEELSAVAGGGIDIQRFCDINLWP